MGKFAAETEAQSRERLSIVALLDVLRDPAIVLDGRFRVVAANASFHSQFGTAAADIDGRPVS